MTKHILHVVTNVGDFDGNPAHPTGLWLGELSHAYDEFAAHGYRQTIVSPQGGLSPLEPKSTKFPIVDRSARAWLADSARLALLRDTLAPSAIDPADFDAIYYTGGHGVMYDFPDAPVLQEITRAIWEQGGIVSSVCHGYCGLLNVTLSDGSLLVHGRKLTGFSWREEILTGVAKLVPYDVEALMIERGALYSKAFLPFVSNVVVDGRLVTGQNPGSAKATAKAVYKRLNEQ